MGSSHAAHAQIESRARTLSTMTNGFSVVRGPSIDVPGNFIGPSQEVGLHAVARPGQGSPVALSSGPFALASAVSFGLAILAPRDLR